MQAFLEQVAKYIKDHHKAELKDQLLVFTNRRASLFFNKYLKRNFNQIRSGLLLIDPNDLSLTSN